MTKLTPLASIVLLALTVGLLAETPNAKIATWRGPRGNGVFPAADIVTTCDEKSGKNIVWKLPLPFMGCSSPVYAAGRVFVLTDPGWDADAAQLHCVDVKTGKKLWTRPVDNLDARPDDVASWARAQRKKEYEMARRSREILYAYQRAQNDQDRKHIACAAEEEGFAVQQSRRGLKLSLTSCKMVFTPPHAKGQNYKRLHDEGLFWWEGWYYHGTIFTGATFPSVVSDGQHVWAYTNNNAVACFDLAGQRKWIIDAMMPGGGHGSGPITTASPLLVGDTLIVVKYDHAVAMNKNTGKVLWRHKLANTGAYQPNCSPAPFNLGGTDFIYLHSGEILRVADGEVAGQLQHPADAAGKKRTHGKYFGAHSQSIAQGDRVWVLHTGYGGGAGRALGGVYAFKLTQTDGKVSGELLWQRSGTGDNFAIALDGQNLYVYNKEMALLDAENGKVLREQKRCSHRAPSFAVTRDHLITLNASRPPKRNADPNYRDTGTLHFYDKKTLAEVGKGTLLMDLPEGDVLKKRIARVAGPWWQWGRSSPTAWGNRVFVRSHDALYCIGDPDKPFVAPEERSKP